MTQQARADHLENLVERAFDGQQQKHRRDDKADDAEQRELAGGLNKVVEGIADFHAGIGHQVGDNGGLQ